MQTKPLLLQICFLLVACTEATSEDEAWQPENEVSWSEAIRILNERDVVFISQSHNLWVGLELSDGKIFFTREPKIDEIFRELDQCSACGEILIAME